MEWDINLKSNKSEQKKKFDPNGVMFSTFIRFLAIVIIIVFLAWISEVIFYKDLYEDVKTSDVKNAVQFVENEYQTNGLNRKIYNITTKDNINISIFKIDSEGEIQIVYNGTRNTSDELKTELNLSLQKLGAESNVSFFSTNADGKTVTIVNKSVIDEQTTYYYGNSFITPVNSTIQVNSLLLLIITLISFVISLLMATYSSKKLANPLQQMAKSAKQLSNGNLNVEFDGGEYTEMQQLATTLNYSISELKKTNELRKDVLSNVSHELKTPLTMIRSYGEMMRDLHLNDEEKLKQDIEVILEESDRLEYLVNDMIDLSKLQSKTMTYNMENFNLAEIIKKLKMFYTSKFKNKGWEIKFDYEDVIVHADKKRIEQVMINLINNAINYSKEKEQIDISLKKCGMCYRFSVKDYGIGISAEDQQHIFEKHFRSNNAKRVVVGSGIGLSIVKEICDYHNYKFGVESELGKGSTFFVDFFAVAPEQPEQENNTLQNKQIEQKTEQKAIKTRKKITKTKKNNEKFKK